MLNLKRNTLSVALASAILMAAGGVNAQAVEDVEKVADPQEGSAADEAQAKKDKEMEAITVLGIRGSIERSINLKVDSDSIVEAISAEDLGKLPDISIADTITRLPGLAAQRVAGRSSTISIRGLSGDYGTTLLNGREQVSVGDNRTVEFDQYPSELINQVVVYKTADASLVGQGLSGTIDLRTVRPLMYQERVASVNVRGEKNSLGEINEEGSDMGSRISGFYVDQFMDGDLGIALGYARLDSPGQAQRYEAWGFPDNIAPANGALTLGGAKLQAPRPTTCARASWACSSTTCPTRTRRCSTSTTRSSRRPRPPASWKWAWAGAAACRWPTRRSPTA
jgi:iron complex outermembrane receptor protein